ncbi:MAG: enoyl-CoA hydratase/isomerase family protein [Armatimonadota bacterium]|nr:enoyl-CoA hydratase/isomerase family protein [Armatimonadota bacterium]MDR7535016.1 enoyl-CoA hydratase/isomerase family protein [Armatimonadota bacterium]
MGYERVQVNTDGPVTTVVLREPSKRNALTPALIDDLLAAIDALASDEQVRAVVIWGAGGVFSSGGDLDHLSEMTGWDAVSIASWSRRFYEGVLRLRTLAAPTIAAINGYAVGAGLGLALACDLRIAGEDARLGAPFLSLGLYPGMGLSYLLTQAVGPARALELLITRQMLDAVTAERLGLVNRVVSADRVLEEAQHLARVVAAGPPVPLRRLKRGIYDATRMDLPAVLDYEIDAQVACYHSADLREALAAVRARRSPEFQGR